MALAVPNFSEAREAETADAVTAAFASRAELIDRHSDEAHNRTVLNLWAEPDSLAESLVAGARACVERIDMRGHAGEHPCVGALDVCPVVWLDPAERDAARTLAMAVARAIADLGVPVFLYGELASAPERAERAHFRRGGLPLLTERLATGELAPDLGPPQPHRTAGATLVTARPPLAAFNVELDTADVGVAKAIAARLRESGGGPPGVRAVGIDLGDRAQVSTNVHDPVGVPLGRVVELVRELAAEHDARPVACEIVGLVPQAALRDLPADVPLRDFDPRSRVLERRVRLGGR